MQLNETSRAGQCTEKQELEGPKNGRAPHGAGRSLMRHGRPRRDAVTVTATPGAGADRRMDGWMDGWMRARSSGWPGRRSPSRKQNGIPYRVLLCGRRPAVRVVAVEARVDRACPQRGAGDGWIDRVRRGLLRGYFFLASK